MVQGGEAPAGLAVGAVGDVVAGGVGHGGPAGGQAPVGPGYGHGGGGGRRVALSQGGAGIKESDRQQRKHDDGREGHDEGEGGLRTAAAGQRHPGPAAGANQAGDAAGIEGAHVDRSPKWVGASEQREPGNPGPGCLAPDNRCGTIICTLQVPDSNIPPPQTIVNSNDFAQYGCKMPTSPAAQIYMDAPDERDGVVSRSSPHRIYCITFIRSITSIRRIYVKFPARMSVSAHAYPLCHCEERSDVAISLN